MSIVIYFAYMVNMHKLQLQEIKQIIKKKPRKNLCLLVQLETIINPLKLLVSVHIYPGQIGDTYPKR